MLANTHFVFSVYLRLRDIIKILLLCVLTAIGGIQLIGQINPCLYEGLSHDYRSGFKVDLLPDAYDISDAFEGNVWLFMGLQSATYEEYRFNKASNGSYSHFFPEANFVLNKPDASEIYYTKDRNRWSVVGDVRLKEGSIEPQVTVYKTPLGGCFPVQVKPVSFYGSAYDYISEKGEKTSARVNIKDDVSISGKLYLPEGIYDAYRFRRDVTYSFDESVRGEFPDEDYASYFFMDVVTGELLMEVRLEADNSINWIRYKSSKENLPKRSKIGSNQFSLYPTLSFGENVRMDFANFAKGTYTLEIYSVMNKLMWSTAFDIQGDTTIKENISFLPKGTYMYSLLDKNRNRILARRLAIIKP